MTFAKLGAFQLTVKTVNAFLLFYFPSCPLSLVYMQVPSSQERASNNFERTLFDFVENLEIVLVGVLVFVITKTKRGLSFRNYEN